MIKKEAPTQYDIYKLLKERWSPRSFSDMPISDNDVRVLLEAGRWAPSSNNLQPWKIIWGKKGDETYDRIFNSLDEFNQSWAGNAPLLMITAYDTKMPNGKDNFHALHDVGLFAMNMSIQAQSMGIAVHQMAGVKHQHAKKEFKFPEQYHVATAVALGHYSEDTGNLEGDLLKMEKNPERSRKHQEEFAFNGDFIDKAEIN